MPRVTDPVCGAAFDPSAAAAQTQYGSKSYLFCCRECQQQFDAHPEAFTEPQRAAGVRDVERHEPPRTTQGGFTAPKFGSAGSGGAEFELLPEAHDRDRRE